MTLEAVSEPLFASQPPSNGDHVRPRALAPETLGYAISSFHRILLPSLGNHGCFVVYNTIRSCLHK